MPLTVFAYTPPGPTPPYINVSRMESGEYRVIVRSELDGALAPTAEMTLPREMVTEMYRSLLRDLMVTERSS